MTNLTQAWARRVDLGRG